MRLTLALLALAVAACGETGVTGPDAAPGSDAVSPGPDALPACQGNNDGIITTDELPMVPGLTVDYLVNAPGTTVEISPWGVDDGLGNITWDFSSETGQVWPVTLHRVAGAWYESEFADAHYASLLAPGNETLGVYRATAEAVWLLGYVSPTPDVTLAAYDRAVPLIRFPVQVGQSWSLVAHITDAIYEEQPFASTDTFNVQVDQRGTLQLPYLSLHNTLRLKVDMHQSLPGGQTLHRIQYLYVHECYGELGRIVSPDGEVNPHFTTAAEFRRLALP